MIWGLWCELVNCTNSFFFNSLPKYSRNLWGSRKLPKQSPWESLLILFLHPKAIRRLTWVMHGIEKLSEDDTRSFWKRKHNTRLCEPDSKALSPTLLHLTDMKHYWTKAPSETIWFVRQLLSEAASDNVLSPVHAHQYISSIPIWRLQPPWMQNGTMRKGRTARALCFMEWDHWGTGRYRRAMRSSQEGEVLSTFYSKDSSNVLWSEGIHSLIKVTDQLWQQRTIDIVAETRGPWLYNF